VKRKLLHKLQAKFCFSHQPNFSYKTMEQAAVYDNDIPSKQLEVHLEISTCYNNKDTKDYEYTLYLLPASETGYTQ
jgi:hypothetical protein